MASSKSACRQSERFKHKAPALLQAEDRVFSYVKEQNRPFNVQLIADMLAQFGVKKPQVQRALDALAESGKLICKVPLYCCQAHA